MRGSPRKFVDVSAAAGLVPAGHDSSKGLGVLAIDGKCSVQKLSYEELRRRLQADKQVLEWKAGAR